MKTESGLLKAKQLLWKTRRSSSRLRTPAMSTPLRPRREDGQRRAGLGPVSGSSAAGSRYFMARARRASCGGHTPSAGDSREPAGARVRVTSFRHKPVSGRLLLSGPQAEAFLLPQLLFALVLGLDGRVPYHSGMTGTVRDITQTRVSHPSEPAKIEADNG